MMGNSYYHAYLIYLYELKIKDTYESDIITYMYTVYILLKIDSNGRQRPKLHAKCDSFNFVTVYFPFSIS
jgi:hypothetical protein